MNKRAYKDSVEETACDTYSSTLRQYSAKEKTRILLDGLRGEGDVAELCRKECLS